MFARWSPIYEEEVADNHYSAADRVAAATIPLLGAHKNPAIADIGIGTGLLAAQIKAAAPCMMVLRRIVSWLGGPARGGSLRRDEGIAPYAPWSVDRG